MPKLVDKEERRLRIVDALCRIAAEKGVEGISVRAVAAEAQLSAGAVQREFGTKEELLHFAFRVIADEITACFGVFQDGVGRPAFPEVLRRVLVDLLPTDERRLAQVRAWNVLYARAVVDPAFGEVLSVLDDRLRAGFLRALERAREKGELASVKDPEAVAELLLVTVDGLWAGCARLSEGDRPDRQLAAVEAAVSWLAR
ncbi:TetR/AcrR family transcriptional regulator [Nocardiopsis sp. NPDC101807]|uniref:TetR/AcrR family transcriptional regulator n=1 Tax=Nocardiopsis sp. NPDC101807 TaxID=3364339 RepID=UPI0037FC1F28